MTGAVAGLVLSLAMIAPSVTAVAAEGYDFNSASSLQVVVNKHRQLNPASYVPGQLVRVQAERLQAPAADAYKQFAKAAKAAGVNIIPISGYRSFSQQASLYDSYVRRRAGDGGYPCRQARLQRTPDRPGDGRRQCQWNLRPASLLRKYTGRPVGGWARLGDGFIIRYPAGAGATTGYTYEPWHLRYVGRAIAEDMHWTGISTLEEYFGLEAAPDYLQ